MLIEDWIPEDGEYTVEWIEEIGTLLITKEVIS
jgi:hypothetical protein